VERREERIMVRRRGRRGQNKKTKNKRINEKQQKE
jgi:hypothetical protein